MTSDLSPIELAPISCYTTAHFPCKTGIIALEDLNSNSAVFLIVSILAGAGRFAAYALSYKGNLLRQSKCTKLIGLAPQPKVNFLLYGVSAFRNFIVHNFGQSYLSSQKFLRVSAVTSFIILGLFFTSHVISDTAWIAPTEHPGQTIPISRRVVAIAVIIMALIAINSIADTFSIAIVRHLVEPFASLPLSPADRRRANVRLSFIPLYAICIYLIFVLTLNVVFSAVITIRGLMAGYPFSEQLSNLLEAQKSIMLSESALRIFSPIELGSDIKIGNGNLFLFSVMPLLPALLLVATVSISAILELIDRISGGEVVKVFSRDTAISSKGVLIAAIIVSIIGGIASLYLGE